MDSRFHIKILCTFLILFHLALFYFYQEYAINLANQLGVGSIKREEKVGKDLQPEVLEKFRDEQVHQLHELYKTAKGLEEETK